MALFNKKAKKTEYNLPAWDAARGEKIMTNLLIATEYECILDPKKKRMSIIRTLKVGSPLAIELSKNKYGEFYIAIDPVTGLDIGSISEGTSQHVLETFKPGTKFIGRVSELGDVTGRGKTDVRIEWRYI